jgi:putative nucleotidyltransferase with HDIG domain
MNARRIISQIDNLAPFSETIHQLIALASDDSKSLAEIAGVIKTDANLVTNVLKLANSAYYGLKHEVDTIDRAVTLLGSQRILEIALLSMTAPAFQAPQKGYGLQKGELWKHSMVSAGYAREIAKQYDLKSADLIFTAGLIKDIGKVILNRYMTDAAEEIDELVNQQKVPFFEAEQKVLGISHAELSAIAFEKWNFPDKLVHIVRNHHLQSAPVVAPRETCTVFLGDTIASMLGIGTGKDGLNYPFSEEILSRYFDFRNLDTLVFSLYTGMGSIADLMNQL